jgi:L-cysteine/cystine lyase
MPSCAIAAMTQANEFLQRSGPFSSAANHWLAQEATELRMAIARELNVTPDTLSLTEDVSVGCNITLWGIEWKPGDHMLISDCEHQGIIAAVKELQYRFQIEVSVMPLLETLNAGDPVAVLQQHLRPQTRLVVVSHILWNTGQVLPLAEMGQVCHAAGAQILVDAAQSVGVVPLSMDEVDFYAFTGHKWWCGPAGVGALYVAPSARETLRPTFIGWRSIVTDATGQPTHYQSDGQRYEIATSAVPLYPGLRSAIAFHHQFGSAEERYQMICDRSAYLWQRLSELPGVRCLRKKPPEAGLVSFQLDQGNHQALVKYLEEQNFLLRVILNPNCVRACTHYFTTETEMDGLIAAIATFV